MTPALWRLHILICLCKLQPSIGSRCSRDLDTLDACQDILDQEVSENSVNHGARVRSATGPYARGKKEGIKPQDEQDGQSEHLKILKESWERFDYMCAKHVYYRL